MDTPIVPTKVNTVFTGRVFTVQVESITLPKGHALDAEIGEVTERLGNPS